MTVTDPVFANKVATTKAYPIHIIIHAYMHKASQVFELRETLNMQGWNNNLANSFEIGIIIHFITLMFFVNEAFGKMYEAVDSKE